MSKQCISTGTFTAATWIVNSDATLGTHTTLAGALISASSGDTILLQTSVTENPTLKAGVNIVGYSGADLNPNVSITGKCTFTTAGAVTIENIRLITNSDNLIVVSGSAASILNLRDCYLSCTTTTGISYSSSSSSSSVNIYNCIGNLGTTGIGYFTATGAGSISIDGGVWTNTGNSTTTSTTSACPVFLNNFSCLAAFACTSTGVFGINNCIISPSSLSLNVTALTTAGTGLSTITNSTFASGTASALSVGSGTTVSCQGVCNFDSTNTNAVTGSGTFLGSSTYSNTSSLNNVTTKTQRNFHTGGISFDYGTNTLNIYKSGSWTPALQFGGSSTGITYSTQTGQYVQIGRIVYFTCTFTLTSKGAQTGVASISGLPVAAINSTDNGIIGFIAGLTVTGSAYFQTGTSSVLGVNQLNSGSASNLSNTAFANNTTLYFNGWYLTA